MYCAAVVPRQFVGFYVCKIVCRFFLECMQGSWECTRCFLLSTHNFAHMYCFSHCRILSVCRALLVCMQGSVGVYEVLC